MIKRALKLFEFKFLIGKLRQTYYWYVVAKDDTFKFLIGKLRPIADMIGTQKELGLNSSLAN